MWANKVPAALFFLTELGSTEQATLEMEFVEFLQRRPFPMWPAWLRSERRISAQSRPIRRDVSAANVTGRKTYNVVASFLHHFAGTRARPNVSSVLRG